jgi:hypothetical protein
MFWLGEIADRLHPAKAISVSLGVLSAGAFCVAVAPVAGVLFAGLFLLRLGGQGLTGHIAIVTPARHGGARRGRVIATAVFGFILAEATLPLLVTNVPAQAHWRWAWALVAALIVLAALPAMRILAAPLPSQPPPEHTPAGAPRLPGRLDLLRDPLFLAALMVVLTTPFVVTAFVPAPGVDCRDSRLAGVRRRPGVPPLRELPGRLDLARGELDRQVRQLQPDARLPAARGARAGRAGRARRERRALADVWRPLFGLVNLPLSMLMSPTAAVLPNFYLEYSAVTLAGSPRPRWSRACSTASPTR